MRRGSFGIPNSTLERLNSGSRPPPVDPDDDMEDEDEMRRGQGGANSMCLPVDAWVSGSDGLFTGSNGKKKKSGIVVAVRMRPLRYRSAGELTGLI